MGVLLTETVYCLRLYGTYYKSIRCSRHRFMNPPFPLQTIYSQKNQNKWLSICICFAFKISDKLWIDTLCNHEKFAGFGQLPPPKNGSKTYWIQRTRQMMDGCYCGPPSWSIEPKILWHASFWLLISPTSALGDKFSMNWCLFRANSQNRSYCKCLQTNNRWAI